MILKRMLLIIFSAGGFGIAFVAYLNERPEVSQIIASWILGIVAIAGSTSLILLAVFGSNDYIDREINWKKFWDRFPL